MAKNTADWYDFALSGLYALTAAVLVGIASVQVFDVAFSDALFSMGGSEITVATALGLSILGVVYLTNDNADISSMDQFYLGALVVTVGLTVAIPFVPAVEDLVTSSDAMRSLSLAVMAIGYGAISYLR